MDSGWMEIDRRASSVYTLCCLLPRSLAFTPSQTAVASIRAMPCHCSALLCYPSAPLCLRQVQNDLRTANVIKWPQTPATWADGDIVDSRISISTEATHHQIVTTIFTAGLSPYVHPMGKPHLSDEMTWPASSLRHHGHYKIPGSSL